MNLLPYFYHAQVPHGLTDDNSWGEAGSVNNEQESEMWQEEYFENMSSWRTTASEIESLQNAGVLKF